MVIHRQVKINDKKEQRFGVCHDAIIKFEVIEIVEVNVRNSSPKKINIMSEYIISRKLLANGRRLVFMLDHALV